MTANIEGDFEFIPKSRQKAEEISKDLSFFGKELFTPEQIEKVREPIRKVGTTWGARLLGAPADLLKMAATFFRVPQRDLEKMPSSENFMKFLERQTGESLAPSGKGEQLAQEYAGGLGSLMGLGGAGGKLATVLLPAINIGLNEGFDQVDKRFFKVPDIIRSGTILLTDMLIGSRGGKGARGIAREYHRAADNVIPEGAMINAKALKRDMENIRTKLSRGGTSPSKVPVLKKADEIINIIDKNNGMIPANETYAFRTAVNDIIKDPTTMTGAKRYLSGINKSLNKELQLYGKTQNPKFLAYLNEGDQILQGLSNSAKATRILRAKAPADLKNPLSWIAFGLSPRTYLSGLGLAKASEMIHRIVTTPALRKHYLNAIGRAFQRGGKGAVNEIKGFERAANKEYPELLEEEFEFIPKNQKSSGK